MDLFISGRTERNILEQICSLCENDIPFLEKTLKAYESSKGLEDLKNKMKNIGYKVE